MTLHYTGGSVLMADDVCEAVMQYARVLAASHDCILGRVPFPGKRSSVPAPPRRPSDWVCGEPLAFLIELLFLNGRSKLTDQQVFSVLQY